MTPKSRVESARRHLSDATRELEEAEKAMEAKPEKLELQHGDYGIDHVGDFCMTVQSHNGVGVKGPLRRVGTTYAYETDADFKAWTVKTKFGNIFTEIEEMAKPLERFKFEPKDKKHDAQPVTVKRVIIDDSLCVVFGDHDWGTHMDIDEAKDFSMKLRRIIHTAEQSCRV